MACTKKKLMNEGAVRKAIATMQLAEKMNPKLKRPKYAYFCKQCKCWHLTRKKNDNFDVDYRVELKNSELAKIV